MILVRVFLRGVWQGTIHINIENKSKNGEREEGKIWSFRIAFSFAAKRNFNVVSFFLFYFS